jgi:ABC-type glycerol-3-phosphate transport system permease component
MITERNAAKSKATKDHIDVRGRSRHFLRQRMVRGVILAFLVVYCLVTLFPFYILFVRTFVGTKDSAKLWLWLPPEEPVSMEAELGNLSVFFSMDIGEFKEHFGIKGYLPPRATLSEIAEDHGIPLEEIQAYLAPIGRFNGWYILFGQGRIWAPLSRTVLVTVLVVVCVNFLSILTAFGLAGLRRRDQMGVYNLYLLRMVIPPMMIIIPQFIIVQWLIRLVPGTESVGLPRYASQLGGMMMTFFVGNALAIMVYTAAIGAIPSDIEDAAYLDGATRFQYLLRIVFPLLKVHIAAVVVMTLPWIWNMFLEPFIYLDPANTTMIPFIQDFSGRYATNFQVTFTGVFVSILPLALLYIIFRRLFIEGVMAGALKG